MADHIEVPICRRPVGRPTATSPEVVIAVALVDERDAGVARHRWRLETTGYARSTSAGLMHRHIMGLVKGDGLEVDHINGNRLDCRRTNMRVVSHAQNTQNVPARVGVSSRYRGVSLDTRSGRWAAYAHTDGKMHHLGRYATEEAAAAAAEAGRGRLMTHHNEARSVACV